MSIFKYKATLLTMKFLKPLLLIAAILILTYSVKAANQSVSSALNHTTLSFNSQINSADQPNQLPINNDVVFAFIAIASLSSYLIFKKN